MNEDGLPPGRRGLAAAAQLISVAMATLDISIANTALPSIAGDLHVDPGDSIWIVNAYQLALVATALPFATLGEIAGHKRVFLWGMALFTLASAACAGAWNLDSLAMARVFQGLGGSAIMAVNAALIRFIYPKAKLGHGMGMNVLVVGVALAVGPTAASLILALGKWPLLFAVNLPLGVAAFVLGAKMLPVTQRFGYKFDFVLAGLNAGAFGFFVLGMSTLAHGGQLVGGTAETMLGLVLGGLMLRRQARHKAPMLPVDLFRIPVFALSSVTAVCTFTTQSLAFVALPFFFEQILGKSQVETGFLITPWPILVAVTAGVAGRLTERYSTAVLSSIGLAALAVGMALLAGLPQRAGVWDIGWRMAICGAGFGFFQSPNLKMLMGSAPAHRAGGASGVITIVRMLGQTLGAALVALCFTLDGRQGAVLALGLGAAFAGAASVASLARRWAGRVEKVEV